MRTETTRRLINISTFISIGLTIALAIYWYRLGVLSNLDTLQAYLTSKGLVGPLIFVGIQIVQVVIPIIPGGITVPAGVFLFGPWYGLLYNYVGIVIGSFINFYLARRYGKPFILHIVKEETYDKYIAYTKNQHKFDVFFGTAIVLPVAPDDVLCLIAGLTEMKWSTFSWIIILGKPITIAAYSLAWAFGAQWLMHLIGG